MYKCIKFICTYVTSNNWKYVKLMRSEIGMWKEEINK